MITDVLQNEATAALRTLTVQLISAGTGVTGVLLTGGTPAILKIAKQGGNFGSSAGPTLTELTGSIGGGWYDLQLAAGDVDTVGDLRIELSPGTGPAFPVVYAVLTVRPALRSADLGANCITASQLAANCITSSQLAANCITASQLNAACITAAKFATDAIDANALKADAATEMATAVWAALLSANHAAGSFGDELGFIAAVSRGNCIIDTITNGSQAGIITAARLRAWRDAASMSGATAGHADNADGEHYRALFTAADAGGGLWTSAQIIRTL